MNERFKVLGAMLALREFTAADLADFSGVNLNTVRVVLGREKEFWEDLGRDASGQRGGQFLRYRVKPEKFGVLEEAIDGLQRDARAIASGRHKRSSDESGSNATVDVPVSLLAAEDALARRFTETTTLGDRIHLLNLAEIGAAKYREQASSNPACNSHLQALEVLREVCLIEIAQESEPGIGPVAFAVLKEKVLKAADALMNENAPQQAAFLLRHVVSGPLVESDTTLQWKLHVLAQAVSHESLYTRLVAVLALGKIVDRIQLNKTALPPYEERVLREALRVSAADKDDEIRKSASEIQQRAEFLRSTSPFGRPISAQRLLVVDDQENVGRVIVEQLQRFGYSAEFESDPTKALQRIEGSHFDLVITDYKMKGLNGLELAKRIRDRNHNIPLVLMSGYGPVTVDNDLFVASVSKADLFPVELRDVITKHVGVPQKQKQLA